MDNNEIEHGNEPTNKRYHLSCTTKFFNKTITEEIGAGKTASYVNEMVFLIPREGDETMRFFNAWLPDQVGEAAEVAAHIVGPVHSPCRLALKRGWDGVCERHYMVVMSKGVAEMIRSHTREGITLRVDTLGAHEDAEADFARESGGSYQKSEWEQAKPGGNPNSVFEREGSQYKKSEWSEGKYKKQKNDW